MKSRDENQHVVIYEFLQTNEVTWIDRSHVSNPNIRTGLLYNIL